MRLALLLTVAACGYKPGVGEQPSGDGPAAGDGPVTPEDTVDAPPDSFIGAAPLPCVQKWLDGTMTFTTPALLSADSSSLFTTAQDRDPWLSSDELTLMYVKPNAGLDADVFVTVRTDLADPFSVPTAFTSLSDPVVDDGKVAMTGDNLFAIVPSLRAGGKGEVDLWQATRATSGSTAFSTLSQMFLDNVNDGGNQRDPHLSPDGLRLYLSTGSPQKIVVGSRANMLMSFSTPAVIPNIGDPAGDADPTLTGDERVILFASNRGGGEGGSDLWYATRPERDQPFSAPIALAEINETDNDSDPFITADGCHLYFASTRAVGADFDLFFAQQDP